jgi:hypothetical protein
LNFEIDKFYKIGRLILLQEEPMESSHRTTATRVAPRAVARSQNFGLRDALGMLAFFLAVGFSAAVVFGLIGH